MSEEVVFSWSSGKDSAMALYELNTNQRYSKYNIKSLLTTVTAVYDRVSMHGVRKTVLERQTASLGLGLHTAYIPQKSTMEIYESVMNGAHIEHKKRGITTIAYGDIYLKTVKKRRMNALDRIEMKSLFPLWAKRTDQLIRDFLDLGFKAYVVCIDSKVLDKSLVGKCLDEEFLNQLPAGVDPCGENGEFHTFVFDGPIFQEPVNCHLGEVILRDSFFFCDILLDY